MTSQTLASRVIIILVGLSAFGLLSIWPLPETIALRHLFLGLGIIGSILYLRPYLQGLANIRAWPLWILLGLYCWLVLHLWLFSSQPALQFHEFRSIWVRSFAAMLIGLSLGIYLSSPIMDAQKIASNLRVAIALLLFFGFLSTFLIFISGYLYKCYVTQQWIPMQAAVWWDFPYRQKPPFVVSTALLLPLCCILLYRTLQGKERPWWAPLSIFAIGLCVASDYLTNTKNGMAMVAITIALFGMYSILKLLSGWVKKTIIRSSAAVFVSICLLASIAWGLKLHVENNPAWAQLIANVKIGVDIDHQNYWKNPNVYVAVPLNEHGTNVDISTYERTAWFTAGLRLLAEKPRGFGLVHHSFGWMALERWPDFYQPIGTTRGMTHSGWLDLALGLGIPGLLLILIPLAVAWQRSLRMSSLWGAYVSWGLPIFALMYLTTEVTGAHHFIELMMFMTAFFVGITLQPPNQSFTNYHQKNKELQ